MLIDLQCREERRRAKVREEDWNGFDFLEIEELTNAAGEPAGVQLRVYLLANNLDADKRLDPCQFVIEGGRRVPRVAVHAAEYQRGSKDPGHERHKRDDTIVLTVDRPNDLSTYTLRLAHDPRCAADNGELLASFDPRYMSLEFSFAVGCPSDLDCAQHQVCPPEPLLEPPIDYLARDYSALRRLLLDRLALTLPEWKRRAIPDQWMALVEALAYTGDRISYYQDAVATEAYLGTARKRISIRRHARLVDYVMHEGCNARAFVCLSQTSQEWVDLDPATISFLTAKSTMIVLTGRRRITPPESSDPLTGREVFEPIIAIDPHELRASDIYDWSEILRIVSEMVLFSPAEERTGPDPGGTRGHESTLEKVWERLAKPTRERLRSDGFDPHQRELQRTFECWIQPHSPWNELTPTDLADLAPFHFHPTTVPWETEWAKWSQFHKLWPDFPAELRTRLSSSGFDEKATALCGKALEWFALRRIGLRLSATLGAQLTSQPDPNDFRLQSSVLAGLNRALHDRGLAESSASASDDSVWIANRAVIQKRFGDAIAQPGKLRIFSAHGEIRFYTWENKECCLPRGATAATLVDFKFDDDSRATGTERARTLHLRVGDILIFEEILGPTTGLKADANPAHRHAVMLTRVVRGFDALYRNPIVEIEWSEEDALPFPLCISVRGPAPECEWIENVSVVRGNVVLVDHGHRIGPEPIGKVPLDIIKNGCRCPGEPADPTTRPGRFIVGLGRREVTFAERPVTVISAARALRQDARRARPVVRLTSIAGDPHGEKPLFTWQEREKKGWLALAAHLAREWQDHALDSAKGDPGALQLIGRLSTGLRAWLVEPATAMADKTPPASDLSADLGAALEAFVSEWEPRFDLLDSEADDLHFVVELDETRKAHLRFGFNGMGRSPQAGEIFSAHYRIGNGLAGNVGAEKITELASDVLSGIQIDVRNPLAAQGGIAPESLEEVRRKAPFVFRRPLERAITAEDYARLAEQCPNVKIQRAATDLRWTGSRFLARVAIDALDRETASTKLLQTIEDWLRPRKRIGHDVEVVSATLVPLRITLHVCVLPHYQPAHIKQTMLEVFGSGLRPNGEKGFFHPDRLTFGEPVRLSTIVATAQAVTGVASIEVREFQRLFSPPNREIDNGFLPLGPLEIAQLDNDPSFPEHGVLTIETGGPE